MKRFVIDTNGFLRFLLDDVSGQSNQIEELLNKAKKGEIQIFLPQIIVFEIVFILEKYYQINKDGVLDKIESLVSIKYIEVESREIFLESISLYRDNPVSFVDCFIFASAQKNSAELFTFDKKLNKLQ